LFDKEGESTQGDAEDNCECKGGGDRVVEDGIGILKVKHFDELNELPKPPLPPPHQDS